MINSKKREDKTKNFKCYKIPIHITYPSFSFYFKYERKKRKRKIIYKKTGSSHSSKLPVYKNSFLKYIYRTFQLSIVHIAVIHRPIRIEFKEISILSDHIHRCIIPTDITKLSGFFQCSSSGI